jgi:predicted  nucleic acid-binding Zn-ribbon protein
MTVSPAFLRDLHSLHRQRAELEARLERGPRQVAAAKAGVDRAAANVESWRQKIREAKLLADRKQLDLKSNEQRIADWQVKLNACSSNREYQMLLEQIAAAQMAGSVLQDEILETLERIDTLEQQTAEAQQQLAQAQAEMQAMADRVATEADGLRSEIARVGGELAVAEKQVPSDLRSDYERTIRQNGVSGMAEVEEGACGGCGQQLSLNQKSDLILQKAVFCGGCGALLYTPPA